jgi:hypothetical protein
MPTATAISTGASAKPSAVTGIEVYETTITLPTYPIQKYLVEQIDPVYNIPVYYFNRAEYEAANPTPTLDEYEGIVLENSYLRLTFLPKLGGRLYSAIIKNQAEQEIFYHNPVVKPSRYGVLQPYEANWWLATGGMDWAYPTQEHGYRFGVPWQYTVTQNAAGATITLSDTAPDRTGLEVSVMLPVDSATFTVAPRLINNVSNTVPVQLWVNAALTLTPGSMSPNTQFLVPTGVITIHSRGEQGWSIPGQREPSPWPVVGQTDLSIYKQWANYLGFFVPNQAAPFMAAYNQQTDLGVIRLSPPAAQGSGKLFAFGLDFPDRSYTDDKSQYFEIWGGANAGFWPEDDIAVPAGGALAWQEQWWPVAGLGGLTWATKDVAMYLNRAGDNDALAAVVSQPRQGRVRASTATNVLLDETFSARPHAPLQWHWTAPSESIKIEFSDSAGALLLEYTTP